MTDLNVTGAGQGLTEPVANVSMEEKICDQCKVDNTLLPAIGWCETCDELLCDNCYNTHRKPRLMRSHQLCSIQDMMIRKQRKIIANKCEDHEGKLLRYFCENHSELGCSQCFVTKHRPCSKVVSIAEVKTSESEDFKALEKLLVELEVRLDASEETRDRNVALITKRYDKSVLDIEAYGEQLKSLIDKLVEKQLSIVEQNKETNLRNMSDMEDTNKDIRDKIQSTKEMVAADREDNRRLFITTKHLQREAASLEAMLRESGRKNKVSEYEFVLNSDLASVLEKVTELGTLADTQLLNTEKATDEVIDEVEVRRFKRMTQSPVWSYGGKSDAIQVSTDHNIRLLYVLLYPCLNGDTEVTMDISEGWYCLFYCKHSHKKTDADVIDVKVANACGTHGVTMQAGHLYNVAVTIKRGMSHCGDNGQTDITVEGVKFSFSNTVSLNGTKVIAGQIAGFKFTRL